jgi:hypothetical protein
MGLIVDTQAPVSGAHLSEAVVVRINGLQSMPEFKWRPIG